VIADILYGSLWILRMWAIMFVLGLIVHMLAPDNPPVVYCPIGGCVS